MVLNALSVYGNDANLPAEIGSNANPTTMPTWKKEPAMLPCSYLIEILTQKRTTLEDAKTGMHIFAERYCRIIDSGCGISVPDNPMGQPRFSLLEAVEFCGLDVHPDRTVMNLNTFHTKEELDDRLKRAADVGLKYLLIIRGDGGPELQRLDPTSIGAQGNIVTTMELLTYINAEYAGVFTTGAAYNQYSRIHFETDRLRKKIDAGAKFVITQPVIGRDPNISLLRDLNTPVVVEAWMSRNVDLLFRSVRAEKDERAEGYDPARNLNTLHEAYPETCVYLSMLGYRQEWKPVLPRL
jgi:methylenetetrahydrofolate reductase (NADPH)